MADNGTKPITKEVAANDQANYYSGITCIKVNGKNAYELKGKFLDDLHNNDFSGTNGEDEIEHIKYFLRIVDLIDLPNVNQDKLRVLVFPISLVGNAWKWFDEIKGSINKKGNDDTDLTNEKGSDLEDECSSDVDETAKIFKIEDNLLDYKTPFLDIDGFCNGGELPGMVQVRCTTYFQDHKWYDELTDGKLKEEALTHKSRIEESWGDANLRVMKFCKWLKNSFKNFHELDYNVLVKLEECWWKVNAHEKAPFARWENYGQGPYVNAKTKKDYDPNLDNNANNAVIMKYLVKISKKALILELKQRYLNITVLTTNTPYPSRKIRRICACTSQKTMKEARSIRRIQGRPIRRIQAMEIQYFGRYRTWSILQETPNTSYRRLSIRRIDLFPDLINRKLKNEF
ncbi:hypothetical protein Tco_0194353 [Tanacetum coccineum]